ncbi:MAG TPA: TolC family protein [Candidatus Bathyarchaeia archaeon]|nr:TolC family protein [Candidatus Bathyarchaeia archaeon]
MHPRLSAFVATVFGALAVLLIAQVAPAQPPIAPVENQAAPVEQPAGSPGATAESELGVPPVAQTTVRESMPEVPPVIGLANAQELALRNNPSLQAAEARIRQARARVRQAVSAYFPQVDTSFTATRTHLAENLLKTGRQAAFNAPLAPLQSQLQQVLAGQASLGDPATFVPQALSAGAAAVTARNAVPDTVENYEAAVTATWLIFDGFGRWFTNAAARFGLRQNEASFHESQRLLLNAVAGAFYNVQFQRENVRIAEADQGYNERLLKDAKARRRVGSGSLSDELNFEIRMRAAEAAVLQAQNGYTVALVGLAALMGLPDAGLPAGTEVAELASESPEELEEPPALDELLASADRRRPDLAAARFGMKTAHAAVGINRAQYFPTAAAFASRNAQRGNNAKFEQDDFASTIGVSVSYDLFTGFRRKAQVAEARAAEDEAQRLLQNAEINAYSEVRQALNDVLTSKRELVLERLNMANVERNRALVEREYEVGQASLVRLNEAQRDLIQAQGRLVFARVSLRQAWFALKTATGESVVPYINESAKAAE